MKVLLCHRPSGAFGYITDGWFNALTHVGFDVQRWNGKQQTWADFDPDLYIGASGHRQGIPLKRRAKVALHVNPYGKSVKGIDEQDKAIEWVKKQRPDAVFGYGLDEHRMYWANWTDRLRIPWVPMPTAADSVYHKNVGQGPRGKNIVYLGGRWPYKATNIDAFLYPLLKSGKFTYNLGGWGTWQEGVNRQKVAAGEENWFYSTGTVAPCISEPHTTTTGIDVPERVFKAIICGCIAVHDPVHGFRDYLKTVYSAKDPQDYVRHVNEILRMSPKDQEDLQISQQEEVYSKHTYFHRLKRLFATLGFNRESDILGEAVA